jgi:hypothetical protein
MIRSRPASIPTVKTRQRAYEQVITNNEQTFETTQKEKVDKQIERTEIYGSGTAPPMGIVKKSIRVGRTDIRPPLP